MSDRIDAHHHLWRYDKEQYGWIGEKMGALTRDFLPKELERELASSGIDGSVAVQARQSLQETDWLLSLADECDAIRGVVGWAAIASSEFPRELESLRRSEKLKGLRHVVQDEPDDQFLLRPDFNRGIERLKHAGLVYDILIFERQLSWMVTRSKFSFWTTLPSRASVTPRLSRGERIFAIWRAAKMCIASCP